MGRNKLIAAQSVITAVLLGVVALTLLSPDESNELFGVNVPDGSDQITQTPPSYEPPEAGGPGGGQAGGGSPTTPPALALTGPSAPSGSTLGTGADGGITAPPPPPPDDDDEDDQGSPGPPGQQYGDTLARLSDAVD